MADEEGSEDTLLDSILEEESEGGDEQGGETAGEEEQEESGESEEGGETEEGSEEQETEAEGGEGPGDEDESEEGEEDEGTERAQPTRGQSRVQRLAQERNQLRAELEMIRRNGGGQGGGQGGNAGGGAQAPTRQQMRDGFKQGIQQKLGNDFALIAPDQQADRLLGAMETILEPLARSIQAGQFGGNDRQQFYEARGNNRWVQANKAEIERRFQDALSKGFPIPREQIARDLAGEKALNQLGAGGKQARKQAQNRKAAAKGTPTKGRGDKGGKTARSDLQDLESRLDGVKI